MMWLYLATGVALMVAAATTATACGESVPAIALGIAGAAHLYAYIMIVMEDER